MSTAYIPNALLHYTHAFLTLALLIRLGAPQIAVDECGVSKGCFRSPVDCDSLTSCDVIVTWQETPDGGSLIFELAGMSPGYVAVGFSGNQLMSSTDVLACVDNNGATLKHFYNPVSHVNEPRTQIGVTDEAASSANGIIQCKFTRVKFLDGQPEFADLREDTYVLLARGRQSGGFLTYHTLGYSISGSKQDFSIYRAPDALPTVHPPGEGNSTASTQVPAGPTDLDATDGSHGLTSPISNGAGRQYGFTTTIIMVTLISISCLLRAI
ncbi:DOMON domain-containing protein FRRS1L-like [Patiria miniata]|uniref:DOMON domain-containing protein n=1 Tax=Patiria miniata TaxID=46514 RepID=A0A914B2I3_PATMI|nr:DOMON domain-containing protein FRRS1L-like [Patiria miniata]